MLAGIRFRPRFLASILDPLYKKTKEFIPTSLGPVDFTPIIIIFWCIILTNVIIMAVPEVQDMISNMRW